MTHPHQSRVDRPEQRRPWPLTRVIAELDALYGPCVLCEQRCGAMRADGERGRCGLADTVHIYNRLLHVGEEAPLVPSYAIFLSGCSMACSFCSEGDHLQAPFKPPPASAEVLALKTAAALLGPASGARNINFVGGEPSIALPFLARFAQALSPLIEAPPLLLNTNGLMTPEALALATHLCEIFVVDLKFGHDHCAQHIADAQDYLAIVRRNLQILHDGPGRVISGVPVQPVVLWVRHLLMPGHLACCTDPTLEWLAEHLPQAQVNVMPAFHPFGLADNASWSTLSKAEKEEGERLLAASGIQNAWFDGRRLAT